MRLQLFKVAIPTNSPKPKPRVEVPVAGTWSFEMKLNGISHGRKVKIRKILGKGRDSKGKGL